MVSACNKSSSKRVNLNVDKRVSLEDIISLTGVADERRVCALQVDGKSSVLMQLKGLEARHPLDYKKLLNVIRLVSQRHEIFNKHVKAGKGRYKGIYEMRGGQARLFYFLDSSGNAIVVCTNLYWKAKPSRAEQNQAFELCLELRELYRNCYEIETP